MTTKNPLCNYSGSIEELHSGDVLPGLASSISDGDTTHAPDGNSVFDALALKAPLASPAFTSTPTAPTAADNTATTQIASTAFAKSQDAVLARLPNQAVNMTAAASGSNGIVVLNNANINPGTTHCAFVWVGSLPNWTPAAAQRLLSKRSASGLNGYELYVTTAGNIVLFFQITGGAGYLAATSTVIPGFVDGTSHQIVVSYNRGVGVSFYVDGVQLGTTIASVDATNLTNTVDLIILGEYYSGARYAGTCSFSATYNRALTAAEVLDLYRNGIAFKHYDSTGVSPASQTPQTSGSLVIGKEYVIDTFAASDDFVNVGGTNVSGTIFTATGATPTNWAHGSSLRRTGATLMLESENIQPAPGQWLDSSGNGLHALHPATGSSLTRPKKTFEIRSVNTWAGTHAAQYLCGINQNILPPGNIRIESITMTGATGANIILGDGSSTNKFVASVAMAAYLDCTIASRSHDGTNMKMVIDPDGNITGSVTTTVKGIILG